MTRHFGFGLTGQSSLKQLLERGLTGYTLESAPPNLLDAVRLHFVGGDILRVCSDATTVSATSWDEVGVLMFSKVSYPEGSEGAVPAVGLSAEWSKIAAIRILRIKLGDVTADSGLRVVNESGSEIVVTAGAFPQSVSFVAPFYAGEFQGEYDLEQFEQVPLEY